MKIRTAIFGVYVAASTVGFAVLMRFMLAEVRPRYIDALRHNLEGAARLIAATLETAPETNAAELRAAGSTLRLRLLAEDGRVLFDTADPGDDDGETPGQGLARRAAMSLLDEETPDGLPEVSGSAHVQLADGRAAVVVLSRPIRSVNAVIWSERKKLASVGLIVAGIMVVAGWWLAAQLTRSLEKLTTYAQAVRDGRPATVPRSRAAEVATLASAFDEMRDALEGRQHAERYTRALAHEVKAPLTAIRGAAELLGEDMSPEQRQQFLGNIRGESARIQRIVERLLELTSLEARKALNQPEWIKAPSLLEEVAEVMRPAYAVQSVALAVETDQELTFRGERFLLRQALLNLLQNALEFSPDGTVVTLRAARVRDAVTFTVEDEGAGVPDYALARVFERFYSLPRPGTGKKSTGIGLALVKEVAHLHGGDVTLTNRPPAGACAVLSIPLERAV